MIYNTNKNMTSIVRENEFDVISLKDYYIDAENAEWLSDYVCIFKQTRELSSKLWKKLMTFSFKL